MVFVAGAKTIDDFLSELAGYLVATGDWETADDQVSGGIALRHIPTNNYLAFKKTYMRSDDDTSWRLTTGIRAVLSSQWDSANHMWAGSFNSVMIGLFENWNDSTNYADDYLNNYMDADNTYNISYWVDKYGVVGVIANPNNYNPESTRGAVGCFFAIEYIPAAAREYNDGLSDFFLITKQNWQPRDIADNAGSEYAYVCARPFSLETASKLYDQHERGAIKSSGNGKVYFEFPLYFNDSGRSIVAAQTKRWFFVEENMGIAIGDVISWIDEENAVTRKFYVAEVNSANRSEKFAVAIPYENAFEYPTA
ncbi:MULTISPECIES: hypothetical protein [unclassified Archaeoglobus]|jgi:hypothetical protein|uniref:hypothetical protein n=1 Tax=unclassified Archaeoglobus TaxID=2643606 RepID=UPI0025C5E74A|nr:MULTISPECIES: hypothetical protein [unclassified Archaeoglobus]